MEIIFLWSQACVCTTATLGTPNLRPFLTCGHCSEVDLKLEWNWDSKIVIAVSRWLLFEVFVSSGLTVLDLANQFWNSDSWVYLWVYFFAQIYWYESWWWIRNNHYHFCKRRKFDVLRWLQRHWHITGHILITFFCSSDNTVMIYYIEFTPRFIFLGDGLPYNTNWQLQIWIPPTWSSLMSYKVNLYIQMHLFKSRHSIFRT